VEGGKTWEIDAVLVVHDDIHAIWINPNDSNHVIIGGDGGVGISRDREKHWSFVGTITAGLFYHVQYDNEYPLMSAVGAGQLRLVRAECDALLSRHSVV
jgi:hypothetical protein